MHTDNQHGNVTHHEASTWPAARTETTAVNANDATLTDLATAQTGGTVAPGSDWNPGFDPVATTTRASRSMAR